MSYRRFLVRRLAFAVASVYLVVTVAFAFVNLMSAQSVDERLARANYSGASPAEAERLREGLMSARNLDRPLGERYVGWLVDVTTLDWGYSLAYQEPVVAVLDGRVGATLAYVVPGLVLAVALGVGAGLAAALRKDGAFDWTARVGSYVLFGVPAFMVVIYAGALGGRRVALPGGASVTVPAPGGHALATLAVAVGLLAGQVRFSRAASLEQTGQPFVKMLRAKGVSRRRLARHVLRNAALPVVSLSLTELLAVLVLNIYIIEEVVGVRGLAGASLRAINEGDAALVIWTTMVIVFFGIAGSFLQDVLAGYLDPRV